MKQILSIILIGALMISMLAVLDRCNDAIDTASEVINNAFYNDGEVLSEPQSDESTESVVESTTDYNTSSTVEADDVKLDENGTYSSKEDVSLYIYTYGKLPSNYITKKEAQKLGWSGGSLEKYAPGKAIGGDRFGNYEGVLPKKNGRTYTECDIDTIGAKSRGAKRIVFSNDGLIYYTGNHYETFELLYGTP